ncbi:MAG TPA: 2-hydroxyhepta-2,4-diene-1,7-dioate isomerase [Actinobacteria bacterium]|jgi:2-keto-4-pentenoate hydratase/2-oxohepta-3-ene-1,7-dioic acid hydratase in catechol pathway|nr:2-hydroxyhepta-2,4-diene-1,7-dioate isomerase [Actinomycetota bacterium]
MRICRVAWNDDVHFGVIEGDAVALLTSHPFGPFEPDGRVLPLSQVRLISPVLPSKIVAVGKNYLDHVREMGGDAPPAEPMIFLKPSTSVIGPGDPILLPWQSEQVEHEAELAVVIGRLCRDVPESLVDDVVLGYSCANDVTARDLQRTDGQWGRAKGFDSFCPLGPWIETTLDIDDAVVECRVNGDLRQSATGADMVRSPRELVSWISSVMTLLPGDVILTGTPAGVGPLAPGDEVSVTIGGVGTLTNTVVDRG